MIRKLSIAMLCTAALLSGCGKEAVAPATTSQPISTRLKWLPGALYLGSIAAKEKGYWSALGLDVKIESGGFEADPIKLVAAGSNDFGITGAEQLLQARANGVPIVAIYMELKDSPIGWMAETKSGITTPQQFVGKTVGAWYGTNSEPTFDALITKLGIDAKSIKRTAVKFDMNPLYSGQVDVMPVYLNGHPLEAKRQGKSVSTINPRDYGIRLYGNVYFTTEKLINEKPELVQKFVTGLAKGWDFTFADTKAAVDVLVKAEPKLDSALELEVLQASKSYFDGGKSEERAGLMTTERWEETKRIMSTYSDLPKTVDVAKAFTNRFVEAAR